MRAPSLGAEAQVLSVRGSEGLLSLFAVCGWEGAGGGAVDPHLSRKGFSDWWWGRRWGPGCVWGGASRRSPRVRVGGWLRRWWVWVMLVVRATGWIGGGRWGADRKKGVRGECNITPRKASLSVKISIKGKETYHSQPDCSNFLCFNLWWPWHRWLLFIKNHLPWEEEANQRRNLGTLF